MTTCKLTIPIPEENVRALHVGDTVRLSGTMVTARDAAYKYMVETFINSDAIPVSKRPLHEELEHLLDGGVIYHCGPVVRSRPSSLPSARGGGAPKGQGGTTRDGSSFSIEACARPEEAMLHHWPKDPFCGIIRLRDRE